MPLKLTTYYHGKDIPDLPGNNTFHSKELFQIYEATPGYSPLLIVATEDGKPVARLLAAIRKTKKWLPSCLVKQCVVYGEGEFLEKTFTAEQKDRFSPSRLRQIKKGLKNGAKVEEAHTTDEIRDFSRMLHKVYSSRIRRYFPANDFFRHMNNMLIKGKQAKIFIVRYKEKIIGGSVCIYSGDNAFLWFSGGMRKTYALQYPGVLAVWKALEDAHERGFRHLEFMDVGLPFRRHGYRDFVLRFGGKQSSTRRWFRVSWPWLNKLMVKFYV